MLSNLDLVHLQVPRAPSLIQLRPHWNLKKHLPSVSGYDPCPSLHKHAHFQRTAGSSARRVVLVQCQHGKGSILHVAPQCVLLLSPG